MQVLDEAMLPAAELQEGHLQDAVEDVDRPRNQSTINMDLAAGDIRSVQPQTSLDITGEMQLTSAVRDDLTRDSGFRDFHLTLLGDANGSCFTYPQNGVVVKIDFCKNSLDI